MKKILLSTCLVAVVGAVSPAFAQEASAPRAGSSSTVGDVVITAERRTQSVQSSSLAIQVLSASALADAGVSQVRDLTAVTPGVNIGQGGPATQIYVRGVGDFGSTPTFNPAVATYVDGVYVARANAIEGNLYDLSRVEVLKGPQGTLYGRNAAGGALNLLTNPAQLGTTAGSLNVEIGTYNEVNTDGFLNVAIGDDLAVRGAFQINSRDGYSSLGFDDDHKQSARLNVNWRPNDDLSLRVVGAWSHIGGIGPGYNFTPIFDPRVRTQMENILTPLGISIPDSNRLSSTDPRVSPIYNTIHAMQTFGLAPFQTMTPSPFCRPTTQATQSYLAGVRTPIPSLLTSNAICNAAARLKNPADTTDYTYMFNPALWQRAAQQDNYNWNLNAELNWNLGFATLTVLPAYRSVLSDYATFPNAPYDDGGRRPEQSFSKSLEVRLANETSLVDWTLGAFFFQERQHQDLGQFVGEDIGIINSESYTPNRFVTSNWAAFAQGTWHLSDALRFITGVRYSEETKKVAGETRLVWPNAAFLQTGLISQRLDCINSPTGECLQDRWAGSVSSTSTTGKLGLEYDIAPQSMLFFTVATGFKAGGVNALSAPGSGFVPFNNDPSAGAIVLQPTGVGQPVPYDPEKLTAFELGSRNRFFDNRLQFNVEAFYWKYKDHQENVSAAITLPNGTTRTVGSLQNVGDATMYGADVDIVARLTDNDTIRFNAEYLHTEYTKFNFILSNVVQGLTIGCPISPGPLGGTFNVNCTGQVLTRAPEWTGSVSYTHNFDLASGATVAAGVTGQFATENYLMPYYEPQHLAPGYFTVGANVTYTSPDGDWTLQAWGRNLTDEDVFTGAFQTPGSPANMLVRNIGAPRTYGIRLGVKF